MKRSIGIIFLLIIISMPLQMSGSIYTDYNAFGLTEAFRNDDTNYVMGYIQNIGLYSVDIQGMTNSLLCEASQYDCTNSIKEIIKAKANLNEKNIWGYAPIDYTVLRNKTENLKILIDYKADINIKDIYGNTPLMEAVIDGNLKIIKLLLDSGADVNIKDKDNKTVLYYAKSDEVKNLLKNYSKSKDTINFSKNNEILSENNPTNKILNQLFTQVKEAEVNNELKKASFCQMLCMTYPLIFLCCLFYKLSVLKNSAFQYKANLFITS